MTCSVGHGSPLLRTAARARSTVSRLSRRPSGSAAGVGVVVPMWALMVTGVPSTPNSATDQANAEVITAAPPAAGYGRYLGTWPKVGILRAGRDGMRERTSGCPLFVVVGWRFCAVMGATGDAVDRRDRDARVICGTSCNGGVSWMTGAADRCQVVRSTGYGQLVA